MVEKVYVEMVFILSFALPEQNPINIDRVLFIQYFIVVFACVFPFRFLYLLKPSAEYKLLTQSQNIMKR